MKIFLFISILFCVLFVIFVAWGSYPWSLKQRVFSGEIHHVEPVGMVGNEDHPSVIRIQTWNLGYLYGLGSAGKGYQVKDEKFYTEKLKQLIEEIKASNPDIICLQEVDFGSNRSQMMNQAEILAREASYPYVALAPSWQANYIPFPYWPFSRHFGYMRSGGAVLSKYPILKNEVTLLKKPESNAWWYNLFYLHRYLQEVEIELAENKIKLINLHLDSFDKLNRLEQIMHLKSVVSAHKVDVVTGDFNMVSSIASKKARFEDSEDNYENDLSFDEMTKTGLAEVIPENIFSQDEARFFTFPSDRPNRRLDYIFYNPAFNLIKTEILPSSISDHYSLKATLQISTPVFTPFAQ